MPAFDPAEADLAHCRALLRRGSKTFSLAARLLPRDARPAVTALYAFCRVSDDLIDQPGAEPIAALALLRARLDKVYAGPRPDDAVDRALAAVVASRRLPRAWLDALLEGYLWDAQGRSYQTLDELLGYAARVAGSVGACMGLFMGVERPEVLARAVELGVAMQLTNIVRDVAEDGRRGRCYLPLEWLAREGLEPDALRAGPWSSPALRRVLEPLLACADALYARADAGIGQLPRRFRPAIRAARLLYSEIGQQVRRSGHDVTRRAVVSLPRKLWLVLRAQRPSPGERAPVDAQPLEATAFLLTAAAPRGLLSPRRAPQPPALPAR